MGWEHLPPGSPSSVDSLPLHQQLRGAYCVPDTEQQSKTQPCPPGRDRVQGTDEKQAPQACRARLQMLRRATEETGQGSWAERVAKVVGAPAIGLPRGTVELKSTEREVRGAGTQGSVPSRGSSEHQAWSRDKCGHVQGTGKIVPGVGSLRPRLTA